MTPEQLAAMIDHTALKTETTPDQIDRLCREAAEYRFCTVCVNSVYVSLANKLLSKDSARVCTVVGFPLGASATQAKVAEANWAINHGASEIDMVIWVGGLKAGRFDEVERDIAEVTAACKQNNAVLKVILECALLTDEEKRRACDLSITAGARFVKTSTGFGPGGAVVEDVRLLSAAVRNFGLGVKAAGGIRSYGEAMAMIEAGATRIGSSAGIKIIEEARRIQRSS